MKQRTLRIPVDFQLMVTRTEVVAVVYTIHIELNKKSD